MKISIIDKIEVPSGLSQHTHAIEKLGDLLATPGRVFFGKIYALEHTSKTTLILKNHETFHTLAKVMGKVVIIALLPLSIISTLFGLAIKTIVRTAYPILSEKYSLPFLLYARTKENFSGILPQNPFTPNCVNSQQKSCWGRMYDTDPIRIPKSTTHPIAALKTIFQTANKPSFDAKQVSLIEEKDNYLHYIYRVVIPSGPLKGTYIDDVDIFYNSHKHHFDIRSASRSGFRDAVNINFSLPGANKKRVEAIRSAFLERL